MLIEGADLAFHSPQDHMQITTTTNAGLAQWIRWLHTQWRLLSRTFNGSAVCSNGCTTSALHLPNPFVVPGGRFVESYYWDTLWIAKGLLVSRMFETVHGLLDNMRWLVDKNGFIPNGNRVYYFNRSQPPVFAMMLMDYVYSCLQHPLNGGNRTLDMVAYIRSYIPYLHKEYSFWMRRRSMELAPLEDDSDPMYDYFAL